MKLLTSECNKAWLFDVFKDEFILRAGFACFLPGCAPILSFEIKGKKVQAIPPIKAIESAVPLRILNARLSLR